jgi:hypothetical protein
MLPQALEEAAKDASVSLVDHYKIIRGRLYRIFDGATEAGDRYAVALLAGKLHENLRDSARLSGQLTSAAAHVIGTQNNLIIGDASYLKAVTAIVAALRPFADARAAVLAVLKQIEHQPEPAAIEAAPIAADAAEAAAA